MANHPRALSQWAAEVSTQMAHLSKRQAMVLALYSFGMVMTNRCGLSSIVTFLSAILEEPPDRLRQRLREWNYEASQKRGEKRRAIEVVHSFGPLLRWILKDWETPRQLTLTMDVTYLAERFMILTISVVYRGSALPVAWRVLRGNAPGEWHPQWMTLLEALKPAIPAKWTIYVLTDRGLYSKRLFEGIVHLGWHPVMRIRMQGMCRRERAQTWRPLHTLARPGMGVWCQRMVCFKGDPLICTLLVQWDARYQEPCLIVTDLPGPQVKTNLYFLRSWIEAGFKDLKRGGLHWEQTKMSDPARVERLWLVMAVAVLWLCRVGGEAHLAWQSGTSPMGTPQSLSCALLGWLTLLAAAFKQRPLPYGRFLPYDWASAP